MSADSPLREYYAARAGEYDQVYEKPERQTDLRRIEEWLLALFRDADVLELACGTGYWTQFLARSARSIVAIDTSAETLRIAAARGPSSNVSWVLGDAFAPKRQSAPFSAAFAGFWFSHVPCERQIEFLSVLNDALEPGARVVFLDNRFVEGSSLPVSEADEGGNTYQSRKLRDGSTHRILKNFPTEAQLLELVGNGLGSAARFTSWQYYWALEYLVPERPLQVRGA